MTKPPVDRRARKRVQLVRPIFARFGPVGVIILDLTEKGARIEHLVNFERGRIAPLRFEWERKVYEAVAEVKACKIHRFAAGDDGATVYQSGLYFTEYADKGEEALQEMTTTIVARELAEHVANLRGVVRHPDDDTSVSRSIIGAPVDMPVDRGYVRCMFFGVNIEKKWSRTPDQPFNGFTLSASESTEAIDQLCETYVKGSWEDRKLITILAKLSVSRP